MWVIMTSTILNANMNNCTRINHKFLHILSQITYHISNAITHTPKLILENWNKQRAQNKTIHTKEEKGTQKCLPAIYKVESNTTFYRIHLISCVYDTF